MIAASAGNYFLGLCIFTVYHKGNPMYPTLFNVVVYNVGQRVEMICRLCCVIGKFRC